MMIVMMGNNHFFSFFLSFFLSFGWNYLVILRFYLRERVGVLFDRVPAMIPAAE